MSDTEIVLRTPADLIKAISGMLIQMNRKQRKEFLQWVKMKRKTYDFQYPQGYVPKEETQNEQTVIVDATGSPVVSGEPVSILTPNSGIVNPQGATVSSQDRDEGAVA